MSSLAMSTWEFPPSKDQGLSDGWSSSYMLVMLGMWWVMMVAMMTPSAAPTILLYVRVHQHHQPDASGAPHTLLFLAGYLLIWLLFSVAATLLHWLLERSGLLHSMLMWSSSAVLSGALLLLAGAYQFTALKHACLIQCRSPAAWLASHWRHGAGGALRMGVHHGLFCVGCCWSLMLLLFAGGVMNLVWIAGLAIVVLLEKILPMGEWLARSSGAVLVTAGIILLLA